MLRRPDLLLSAASGGAITLVVGLWCAPGKSANDVSMYLARFIQGVDKDRDGLITRGEVATAAALVAGILALGLALWSVFLRSVNCAYVSMKAYEQWCRTEVLLHEDPIPTLMGAASAPPRPASGFRASVCRIPSPSLRPSPRQDILGDDVVRFLYEEFSSRGAVPESPPMEDASPDATPARLHGRRSSVSEIFCLDHAFSVEYQSEPFQELARGFDSWGFDMFRVLEATQQPLVFTGYVCLSQFSNAVVMHKGKLLEFLRDVEGSYRDVPYHNNLHGACIARFMYAFCHSYGLGRRLPGLMQFALVLAGLVHDVNHPGVQASFLLKAGKRLDPMDLGVKYNDQSPLENMHLAVAFELLRREKNAFLSSETISSIRSALIKAVLGTDSTKHAEQMTRMAALVDNLSHQGAAHSIPWYWPSQAPKHFSEADRAAWESKLQEEFIMEVFLHAADISSPTLPNDQFRRYDRLVLEEFYAQGDREKAEFGRLISPPGGFDRTASAREAHHFKSFFVMSLALPLFTKINELTQLDHPTCIACGVNVSELLGNLHENIKRLEEDAPPSCKA